MAQAVDLSKYDLLKVVSNRDVETMLKAEGESGESVIYSEKIKKINRKGKQQARAILITEKAIYNFKVGSYRKPLRRISIIDIGMITLSTKTPEFVIHVPTEYDYHLASKNQTVIADILAKHFELLMDRELLVTKVDMKHLKEFVLTKKLAGYEGVDTKHATIQKMKSTHSVEQHEVVPGASDDDDVYPDDDAYADADF